MNKATAKKALKKTTRKEPLSASNIYTPVLKGGVHIRDVISVVRDLKSDASKTDDKKNNRRMIIKKK